MTGTMSVSSLNTFPLSTWNAAEAFKLGMVSTDVKFNSIILRISHRKIMELCLVYKRQLICICLLVLLGNRYVIVRLCLVDARYRKNTYPQ